MSARLWRYGKPIELIIVKERVDLMGMLDYAICDADDADAMKAVIHGIRAYYQHEYLAMKEKYERNMKTMEEAENKKEGEQ